MLSGTNQIRRVCLPRVADSSGLVSYDELVGLCVTFTFPEGSPENYEVSLTYFDVDDDTVTIASTHELVDAIGQYTHKKVLRITTEVKPKNGSSASPAAGSPATVGANNAPAMQPQIKNVLESFVGVLSTAVSHLQEGLNAPDTNPPSASTRTTPSDVAPAATGRGIVPPVATTTQVASTQFPQQTNTETAEESPEEEENLFIHGRHTCDSCLNTPIIGKRFHATNLPDYDLCQKCHDNYKGTEVKFESVELDRDRAFQTRWQRRHLKIKRFQARQANKTNRGNGRMGRGQRRYRRVGGNCAQRSEPARRPEPSAPVSKPPVPAVLPPFAPHPPIPDHPPMPPRIHIHGVPPQVPAPSVPAPFGAHVPPNGPSHWANIRNNPNSLGSIANEYDSALKEAIRRSLKDVTTEEKKPETELKEPPQPADETSNDVETPEEKPAVKETPECDIVVAPTETEKSSEDVEAATETMDVEDTKAMEEAMETGSVDSEKLMAEGDRKPAAVDRETSDITNDESFQSEAVGSGEVAEAVGATLDLVAGMISEMLSEADFPTKKPSPDTADKPSESGAPSEKAASEASKDIESSENGKAVESVAAEGALIMETNETADTGSVVSKEEDGEWEVVGSDENIARAAEMLGSVLFNSDMKSSKENESQANMSNLSDSFSVPSTVPSIHVGAPQRARWVCQLEKLRELGFDNEAQCVEILERLQAANIGADEEDEISVTKVVNAILEQE